MEIVLILIAMTLIDIILGCPVASLLASFDLVVVSLLVSSAFEVGIEAVGILVDVVRTSSAGPHNIESINIGKEMGIYTHM